MSDGSEANPVSDGSQANAVSPVSADDVSADVTLGGAAPHEPHIKVLKGQPTDEELAALVAVLGGVGGGEPVLPPAERSKWGLPIDRLRFAMSNYQRLTFLQMTHLKK